MARPHFVSPCVAFTRYERIQDSDLFFLKGGGGGAKDFARANITSAKHEVPYSRDPGPAWLRALGALRVFDALSFYLSLIFEHSDTKWDPLDPPLQEVFMWKCERGITLTPALFRRMEKKAIEYPRRDPNLSMRTSPKTTLRSLLLSKMRQLPVFPHDSWNIRHAVWMAAPK